MGSQSDYSVMRECEKILKLLKVKYQTLIVSAHRTPKRMFQFAETAEKSGFGVIVAGAGGAAHLAGMVASLTTLPVLGVPMETKKINIDGGAIALGHPLGATGARITGKAAELLKREGGKYALSTQCIGLGMGIATIIESV